MPARVVVVFDDPLFVAEASAALRSAGYSVAGFTDPMVALFALEAAESVNLLIARVLFGGDRTHGIKLARITLTGRPSLRVLFIALPAFEGLVRGIGEFMPLPVRVPDLVEAASKPVTS